MHELPSHRAFYFLFFRWQGEKFFSPWSMHHQPAFLQWALVFKSRLIRILFVLFAATTRDEAEVIIDQQVRCLFFKAASKPIRHSRSGLLFLVISLVLTSIQPSMSDLATSTIRFRPAIFSKLQSEEWPDLQPLIVPECEPVKGTTHKAYSHRFLRLSRNLCSSKFTFR